MQSDTNKFPRGVEVVGSAIIERADGRLLMVRSPKWHDKWLMPGGHIEPGETIEAAVRREAEEETGIQLAAKGIIVSFGEIIGSADFHRPAHLVYFDVWFRLADAAAVELDGTELTEHVFVTPQEALKMDLAGSYDKTIRDFLAFKERTGGA